MAKKNYPYYDESIEPDETTLQLVSLFESVFGPDCQVHTFPECDEKDFQDFLAEMDRACLKYQLD